MPSSMWRPWSDSRQRTSVSVSSANQSIRSPRLPDAGLVDPAAEVGRGADVGRDRDDALGHLGRLAREVDEEAPEGLLGRAPCRCACGRGRRGTFGGGHGAASAPRLSRAPVARAQLAPRASRGRAARTGRPRPRRAWPPSSRYCVVVEQRGVVGGVALGRQRPALDRVGEDDARAVADRVGLAVAVEQAGEVVAAEVAEGRAAARASSRSSTSTSMRRRAARARRRAGAAGTPRWASRRCGRAGSGRCCSRGPYLTITVCQPAASNIAARRPAAMSGTTRSSDWRLRSTTHITSPRRATIGSAIASQHGALVELGVADQRDLAAAARRRRSARRRSGARARPRSARWRRGRR